MDYIRRVYGCPARRGGRVLFQGHPGTIVGARRHYLLVRFDGERRRAICHPIWEMEYL